MRKLLLMAFMTLVLFMAACGDDEDTNPYTISYMVYTAGTGSADMSSIHWFDENGTDNLVGSVSITLPWSNQFTATARPREYTLKAAALLDSDCQFYAVIYTNGSQAKKELVTGYAGITNLVVSFTVE